MTQPSSKRLLTEAKGNSTFARHPKDYPLPIPAMVTADPKPVFMSYSPASLTQSATSTTVSYTDVDATNLKATFVAPPSGKVRIRLRAGAATSAANVQLRWVAAIDGNTVPSSEQIAVQAPASGGTETTSTVVEMVVSVDGVGASGTPLVPGRAYTFTWRQRCNLSGQAGYTRYGSTYGPASIEVIPVVHRITETPMTVTESAAVGTGGFGGHVPLWLCKDGKTLLGRGGVGTYISWSTDDGATWTNHSQGLANGAQHIREMDNGEVIVFAEALVAPGDNASVWVSSGWATNPATATFTKTLVSGKAGTDRIAWREWSMDTYGPIVLAAEYGPKVSRSNMAGQVHMSEDYGQTWRVIFDLADVDKSTGVDAHLHGVKYDPFWDAIWVSNGDFVQNAANWLSLDRGKTWRKLPFMHQVTNMYPMPDCILFVTDTGDPNGIYRIRRTHPDSLVAEMAWLQDAQTGITMLGTQIFQLRSLPGAPVLMSADAGNVAGQPARLFATYDGYNFREVWKDTQTYINHGLRTMVGPTATGKYHGRLDRVTNYAVDSVVVTLSPPA